MIMPPMFFEIVYVLILLIGILVVLKSHQLTKPYKYLWVILVLLFNLLGIIAFLIYNMNRVNFFLYALCKSGMDWIDHWNWLFFFDLATVIMMVAKFLILDKDTGGAPFFINAIVVSVYNHKTYLKSEVFRGIPLKTSD